MKLIFIYGPPAVGKLTVAELLSQRTGIPLFHNHISRDLVADIYGKALDEHYHLVDTLRLDVFEYCAKHGTDLIFTYVYDGPTDYEKVEEFIETIESNDGEIQFVELKANRDDLIDRVDNESRKKYKKLTDVAIMKDLTENMEMYTIPDIESLLIDTSRYTPEQSVDMIVAELSRV